MDFIIANANREDIGFIQKNAYLDLDVGDTNDYLLKVKLAVYDPKIYTAGNILFCIDTEYGGILHNPEVNTKNGQISFTGETFRGMLANKIVKPQTVSGELNTVLNSLIGSQFGSLFSVSGESTGVSANYKVAEYSTLLDVITKVFASVDYRLDIKCMYVNDVITVVLAAVPIADYSEDVEHSQDSNIHFTIKKYTNNYTHMICYYETEAEDKTKKSAIARYQLLDSGKISEIDSIPDGLDVKVHFREFGTVDDTEEFKKSIQEEFEKINSTDTQAITVPDDLELELGDIVGGRDYVTSAYIKQAITQKIVKIQNGITKISYKVGDGD